MNEIIWFGNEALSSAIDYQQAPILKMLLENKYCIKAVIIKDNVGRSRQRREFATLKLAQAYDLKIIRVENNHDLKLAFLNLSADLGILASFGCLIPLDIIKIFRLGIVNIHPSLLPLYRGTTPIENALLNKDLKTGVSLMDLTKEMDAGDIYAQKELPILRQESKLSLTQRLGQLSAKMLKTNLPLILKNKLNPFVQDHKKATYTQLIHPKSPHQLEQKPADYWQSYIRAFLNCPNNKYLINEQIVEITQAKVIKKELNQPFMFDNQKRLLARCSKDSLQIQMLKPQNRTNMTAIDFINGFGLNI